MNMSRELTIIRELLDLTQDKLAEKLNVSFKTIDRWESKKNDVEINDIEKIYNFSYSNGISLNSIFEQLLIEQYNSMSTKVLFHGCKLNEIQFPIDLLHSKKTNDFGKGFYLGENFKQAASYISNSNYSNVYIFTFDISKLNVYNFNVSKEWMLAISHYRGGISKYSNNSYLKSIIENVENSDVIIAPIADNRMFDIISEFTRGEITDLQCQHALAATNLGYQYVLKSQKALDKLSLLRISYVSKLEKETLLNERLDMNNLSENKIKVARIEYRGKGYYIDEVLK